VPSIETMGIALVIVAFASALQASIGFGLALVAAPLLALLDRAYVPGPLIAAGLGLCLAMAWRERGAIDTRGLPAAVSGRLLGVLPAGYVLSVASQSAFDLLFASLVLLGVGLSLLHTRIVPTPRAVFGASALSGLMGTITSIGGPPLALVYQSQSGPVLRATLAANFAVGCLLSLTTLAVIGLFGRSEVWLAATLLPGVVLGLLISRPLRGLLDRGATRPWVLGLSAISALAVLTRALA